MSSNANCYCYDESEIEAFVQTHGDRLERPNLHGNTTEVAAPVLVMIKPGLPVERPEPKPTTLRANERMSEELTGQQIRSDAVLSFMQDEKIRARNSRKAAEAKRINAVVSQKAKAGRSRMTQSVLETDGHRRLVRKFQTTAEKLLKDKRLPPHLKSALDAFAIMAADAVGAATLDGDDSTSRLTISYEGFSGGSSFGSKTLSDRQLNGLTAIREMAALIPEELRDVFAQVLAEEIGYMDPKRRTLAEIGEAMGYLHKQSSAAGGATVYCVASLVAHYMRGRSIICDKTAQVSDFRGLQRKIA